MRDIHWRRCSILIRDTWRAKNRLQRIFSQCMTGGFEHLAASTRSAPPLMSRAITRPLASCRCIRELLSLTRTVYSPRSTDDNQQWGRHSLALPTTVLLLPKYRSRLFLSYFDKRFSCRALTAPCSLSPSTCCKRKRTHSLIYFWRLN